NKIYNLSGSNAGSAVSGIYVSNGNTTGIFNNIIGDLRATAANSGSAIAGVHLNGGSGIGLYYNTIHLNAVSSGTSFGTAALYASDSPSIELRNNIFMNVSVPTGTGSTVAFRRSGTN